MSGILYGLGLGPGDPNLITIKAASILRDVPVIVYLTPFTKNKADFSFARSIAAPHFSDEKTEINVPIQMLKDPKSGKRAYREACDKISTHLKAGRDVAYLCEGDPLLYGSFVYVLTLLRNTYRVITVPGVSSLSGAAAAANLPLVTRNQGFSIIPATLSEGVIKELVKKADAIAIFKLGKNIIKVKKILSELGSFQQAVYVEYASMPDQRVLMLRQAPDDAPYFSLILVTKEKKD